jgi:hypothetical protein
MCLYFHPTSCWEKWCGTSTRRAWAPLPRPAVPAPAHAELDCKNDSLLVVSSSTCAEGRVHVVAWLSLWFVWFSLHRPAWALPLLPQPALPPTLSHHLHFSVSDLDWFAVGVPSLPAGCRAPLRVPTPRPHQLQRWRTPSSRLPVVRSRSRKPRLQRRQRRCGRQLPRQRWHVQHVQLRWPGKHPLGQRQQRGQRQQGKRNRKPRRRRGR